MKKNSLKEAPYRDVYYYKRNDLGEEVREFQSRELMSYVGYPGKTDEWIPNEPFHAILTLQGSSRGRSSAVFNWTDSEGTRYPMFMASMTYLLENSDVFHGTVEGQWIVVKKGTNYGLELYVEDTN